MSEIFKNILFPHRLPRKILQDAGIICKSCILSMLHIPQPIVPLKYLMLVMFLNICNLSTFNDANFLHDNEIPNSEKYNKCMEEIVVAHVRDFANAWGLHAAAHSLAVFGTIFVNTCVLLVFNEVVAVWATKLAITSAYSSIFFNLLLSFKVTAISKETKFLSQLWEYLCKLQLLS